MVIVLPDIVCELEVRTEPELHKIPVIDATKESQGDISDLLILPVKILAESVVVVKATRITDSRNNVFILEENT